MISFVMHLIFILFLLVNFLPVQKETCFTFQMTGSRVFTFHQIFSYKSLCTYSNVVRQIKITGVHKHIIHRQIIFINYIMVSKIYSIYVELLWYTLIYFCFLVQNYLDLGLHRLIITNTEVTILQPS